MADGESARLQDHALGHAQHDHVKSIPSPIPKIVYEAPSFRTFQETKKSKLLRQVQTEDYRPSRQPQSRLESFGRLNFDSENIVERAGSPVTLTGPVVTDANASASSEWQRPSSIPAHQPWGETFIGRSDTMSSVRSLDRCASPTKRPLPRPPTGVAPSKSLDRGAPDRSQAGTTSPAIVLVAPPIEVNDTPDDYAETIISDKRNYLASLPSDVILGDAATILPNPGTSAKASLQPSLPLQGGMSYSHSPVITVSTGSLRDPSGFKDSPIGADVAIICAACDGPVIGRTVNAMSQHFHPECYRCAQCGERLEHVSSYEWEGKAFCHLDYHDKFAYRCHHCQTPIVEPRFITLDDEVLGRRFYHELHFFCCECGDPFLHPSDSSAAGAEGEAEETGAFVIHKGHPYCERCHLRLHKPKCRACKLPIPDAALKALGSHWHPECFICSICGEAFANGLYFLVDCRAVCRQCYDEIR